MLLDDDDADLSAAAADLLCRAGEGTDTHLPSWMAAAAPKTLAEVASSACIPVRELKLYDAADFDELLKELGIPVTVKVRLKKQHRDLLRGHTQATAHSKFDAFLERVGGADALAGLDKVPLASLDDALGFIAGPGAPSPAALRGAATAAYATADSLLASGPDPHGLSRDEIAAINIYTQQALFRQLNAAMRSELRSNVKAPSSGGAFPPHRQTWRRWTASSAAPSA